MVSEIVQGIEVSCKRRWAGRVAILNNICGRRERTRNVTRFGFKAGIRQRRV